MAQIAKFWAVSGLHEVLEGWGWAQIIHISPVIHCLYTLLALESTQGPKDGPDGQVLAVSGSHDVLGGRKVVQNDPYNFLLPPDFMKLFSKWLPWGCRQPLPSPCCSSGGHHWNPEFLGFSKPVDFPEHEESGLVSVRIFEDLRYYCRVHSAKYKNRIWFRALCFE